MRRTPFSRRLTKNDVVRRKTSRIRVTLDVTEPGVAWAASNGLEGATHQEVKPGLKQISPNWGEDRRV